MSASNTGRWAFEPAATPSLPIRGSDALFPVHRIYCIGRNFAAHAIEMGHDPNREPPFFFQKNPDNLVTDGRFPYPDRSDDVHFELELVVALAKGGKNIPIDQALDHVYGYGVGLDMTRRDLQGEAKKLGRPWEIGKAFDASAPCTEIIPASELGHPNQGRVWMKCDDELRQEGDLNQMIWKVPEMISYLSDYFTLAAGDLIFTGTPAGVGAVKRGNVLVGGVDGVTELKVTVV